MRGWLRENSLSLFFLVLFLATVLGQSIAGHLEYNEELRAHGDATISWGRYVISSQFGAAVMENWQSEFLQFSFFIAATIWLVQRGSAESKKLDAAGLQTDQEQRVGEHAVQRSPAWARVKDWHYKLYSNSLMIVMTALFFGSWFAQSVTDWTTFNEEQLDHQEQTVSWLSYIGRADFWEKTLQTGSRSSSPSARWPSSRSTSGNGDRRSRSPSGRRTTRPAPRSSPDRRDRWAVRSAA